MWDVQIEKLARLRGKHSLYQLGGQLKFGCPENSRQRKHSICIRLLAQTEGKYEICVKYEICNEIYMHCNCWFVTETDTSRGFIDQESLKIATMSYIFHVDSFQKLNQILSRLPLLWLNLTTTIQATCIPKDSKFNTRYESI